MQTGDLIRYREIINHRTKETTEWFLGMLLKKEYSICHVLARNGNVIRVWASHVQKAGKKDANN
jgi:hypothetical protein